MNQIKKLKQSLKKGKEVAHWVSEATKLRFNCIDVERQIKYGVPGMPKAKGVLASERYQNLSAEGKEKALAIIDEECCAQNLWKAKDLVKLARRIEKRLKAECV